MVPRLPLQARGPPRRAGAGLRGARHPRDRADRRPAIQAVHAARPLVRDRAPGRVGASSRPASGLRSHERADQQEPEGQLAVARIRTIKPEFFQDEKLSSMSMADRFIFLGLISMADDAGRLLDNVKVIEAFIFPTTDDRVHESLMNLAREGRIRRGITSSGQKVIQILGWSKHQYVQHPNLKAALPELVEDTPLTTDAAVSHESFMNENSGPHESFRLRPTTYDLRSTTNDIKPAGREKRTKAPRSESIPERDTWLTPLRDAWEKHGGIGSFNFGIAAKAYGPIVKRGVP